MIEKRQRTIAGERREPQRQPRQLHRGGIEIDAVQTALGDIAAEGRAIAGVDVGRRATRRRESSPARNIGEEVTRAHQERAAAHRRIDDAQG